MNTITKILDALGKSRLLSSVALSDEALIFGLGAALFVELVKYLNEREVFADNDDGSPNIRSKKRG